MNINDPEVHRLAYKLAALRGTSATAAVRAALEHELQREQEAQAIDWAAFEAIRERIKPESAEWLSDDDLFGGNP